MLFLEKKQQGEITSRFSYRVWLLFADIWTSEF